MKINSGFNYLNCDLITTLKDSRLSKAISQNKKIIAVATAILSALVIGCAIYRYYSKAKPPVSSGSQSKTTTASQELLNPGKSKEKIGSPELKEQNNTHTTDTSQTQTSQSNDVPPLVKENLSEDLQNASEKVTITEPLLSNPQGEQTPNTSSPKAGGEIITTDSPNKTSSDDSKTSQLILPLTSDEKPVVQDAAPENVIVVESEEEKVKKNIIADFGPEMVEALGGVEKVLSIPLITHWSGHLTIKDFTGPIMRGYHEKGRPFLLFCYATKQESTSRKITAEHMERTQEGLWKGTYSYPNELNFRFPNPVDMNSLAGKHIQDRIRRFINIEPLGMLEKYKDVVICKPADLEEIRPDNAYLEGDELTQYMELETIFYERKPPKGTSEILLWDPTKSEDENYASIVKIIQDRKKANGTIENE